MEKFYYLYEAEENYAFEVTANSMYEAAELMLKECGLDEFYLCGSLISSAGKGITKEGRYIDLGVDHYAGQNVTACLITKEEYDGHPRKEQLSEED